MEVVALSHGTKVGVRICGISSWKATRMRAGSKMCDVGCALRVETALQVRLQRSIMMACSKMRLQASTRCLNDCCICTGRPLML